MKRQFLALLVISILIGGTDFGGNAADAAPSKYPAKAVNLIVPWNPGGGADITARTMASIAPKYLGQSLIVINKPGASGAMGHTEASKAKKDGYTLLITGNSPSTVVPNLGKVNYDPLNDFEFILRITNLRNCFGVAANSPFNTIDELIAYIKTNPGKVKIGTSGANGIDDLVVRMFNKKAGIEAVQVPFESSAEAIVAVMGGHIAVFSGSVTSVLPMVQNKNMKILAITADARDPIFPDIPTLKDRGLDVSLNNQIGIGAPRGTPKAVLDFLHGAFKQSIEDAGFKAMAQRLNFSMDYLNGADFRNAIQSDSNKIKAIVVKQ